MRPFHLAILECDSPLSGTHAKYGGYGDVFTALLRSGADALGDPDLIVSSDSNANPTSDSNGISNSTIDPKPEERNGADGKGRRRRLRITKWNVEKDMQRYPALDEIDGILVTGSSEWPSLFSTLHPPPHRVRIGTEAPEEQKKREQVLHQQ